MSNKNEGRKAFTKVEEEKIEHRITKTIIIHRLIKYIRPYRTKLAVLILFTIVHGLVHLIEPLLHLLLIDNILIPMNFNGFYWWVPLSLLVIFIHCLGSIIQQYNISDVGNNITADIRTDLMSHIQNISLRYFSEGETGRVMSRVTNDVEILTQFLAWRGIPNSIMDLIAIIGTSMILTALNWKLMLVTLAVSLLAIFLLSVLGNYSISANRTVRAKMGGLTSKLQEYISGMKVVKSFQQETEVLNLFDQANNEYYTANINAAKISSTMEPTVDLVRGIGVASILYYGSVLAYSGQLTIGEIVAFMEFTVEFYRPLRSLARIFDMYTSSIAASERIFALQDTTSEIKELPMESRIELDSFKKEIKFEDVTFGYDFENPVIKHFSYNIHYDEKIAIVGPTGSGKSTLINLLCRFYDPQEGKISIDGIDIRNLSLQSLRSLIGVVLQDSFLFEDTILENIRYSKPNATDDEVIEASKVVGADKFIINLQDGYNTKIEEGSSNISIGQRQLISFARTLLKNPRILILDEATSSVDPYTELYIQNALKILLENRTAIIIAHRLSTVKIANKIIVLDDGRVVEEGSHQELMAKGGLYSTYYKTQFEKILE